MHPFSIATGTMHYAQNIFIRVHTDKGYYGAGECSAFPMITGETQNTCFEMAREFAALWKGKDPHDIPMRLQQLHDCAAFNATIKSAFDMALYDIAAKYACKPLYQYLGGAKKPMKTDLTIGMKEAASMASIASKFVQDGVDIIKVKLGGIPEEDILRVKLIREAAGNAVTLRVDANQGWTYEDATQVLNAIAPFNIEFCEQPMRRWNDHLLPFLKKHSPVPIMADESVYNYHDAQRLINTKACDYVNIKFAKSGGIAEAERIHNICAQHNIPCMMGGMLESRMALTAFAHFASARDNIRFYDMDTCMLGHKTDPVTGGVRFNKFVVELPDTPGIGADIDEQFLKSCEHIAV